MAKLTSENVETTMRDCLSKSPNALIVEGIMRRFALDPSRVDAHRDKIREMLTELPSEYRKSGGGGWSFLNACNASDGRQWTGLHTIMEQLFVLGIATDLVTEQFPREMWSALPGGMPYYVINF